LTEDAREPVQRLFFALWPSSEMRRELSLATQKQVSDCRGRAVPCHNLHATLAFLGNVPQSRVAELMRLARGQAAAFAQVPLSLRFDTLEHWSRPKILCALATQASPQASALAAALKDSTVAAGFHPDLKPFRAHVTVARKVADCPQLPPLSPVVWHFEAFALIDSRTEMAGPVYSVVESWPLVKIEKACK
jgi:RNA 2',3'-cyclic 3'-phosphodiesterase